MTNYYVATTGNDDNDGSTGTPWATINHAIDWVTLNGSPGDVIRVKAGTYDEQVNFYNLQGSAGNYYTLCPDAGNQTVTITHNVGTGGPHEVGILSFTGTNSYIHVSGMIITDSGYDLAIKIRDGNAQHITIDYCKVHNSQGSAISVRSNTIASGITFAYNTVYNVNNGVVRDGDAEFINGSQEAISFSNVNGFNIHHNLLYNYGREGIDMKSGTKNGVCHHNWVECSPPPNGFNSSWSHMGVYIDGYSTTCSNILVSSNYVTGYAGYAYLAGAEGAGDVEDITFCNNIANMYYKAGYSTGFCAFRDGVVNTQPWTRVKIYNNTFYAGGGLTQVTRIRQGISQFTDCVIANNIICGDMASLMTWNITADNSELTMRNNLFYRYGGTLTATWWDNNTGDIINENPSFIRRENGFGGDFRLSDGFSPAISGGTTLYTTIVDKSGTTRGTQIDIGAFEFNSTQEQTNPPGNLYPEALFNYSGVTNNKSPIINENINFYGSVSTDADGTITNYEWDWDNDGIYESSNANGDYFHYSWANPGTYKIILRVTDDDGATDTYSYDLYVDYTSPTPSEGWYDSNWLYRKTITIKYPLISGNQTNFPLFYKLNEDTDMASHANNSGKDIIFVDSDGTTRLCHEKDTYSNGNGTFWIKIPSLQDSKYITDKVIYVYYGNDDGVDYSNLAGYKPSSVWDNDYVFVCHMNDNGNDYTLKDSSRWNNSTRKCISNSPMMIKSMIGSSQLFIDRSGSYISSNKIDAYYVTAQATVSFWISGILQYDHYGYIFSRGYPENTQIKPLASYIGDATTYGSYQSYYINISTNRTRYLDNSDTYNGGVNYLSMYYNSGIGCGYYNNNGIDLLNDTELGNLASGTALYGILIGNRGDKTRALSGSIDELRYSRKYRTKGRHITEYSNIMMYDDFISITSEETEFESVTHIMTIAGSTWSRISGFGYMKIN